MFWTSTLFILQLPRKDKWVGRTNGSISHSWWVSANMQERAGKPWSRHTHQQEAKHELPSNVARTRCVLPKQNSMYLRQFLFKKQNKTKRTLKILLGKNLLNLKNSPLPKVNCGRGVLLLSPPFPLQVWFVHVYGNYKRDRCSLRELSEKCRQQLNNPTTRSSCIYWVFATCQP